MKNLIKYPVIVSCLLLLLSSTGVADSSADLDRIVRLTMGDWSGDGHGKTKDIFIHTNLTKPEIQKAVTAGNAMLGFDFSNQVAVDFEDPLLSKNWLKKIRDRGIRVDIENEELYRSRDIVGLTTDSFVQIWLGIAKLGNNKFKFEVMKEKGWIDIGGYGLFKL